MIIAEIRRVEKDTELHRELIRFVENCSWAEAKDHIAMVLRSWLFTDWEAMFAAVVNGRIVGMTSIAKTDYYPLPQIFPWISCVFVAEAYRGNRISEQMIAYANRYALDYGFTRTYIPSEHIGLYEKYGYRYIKDIVNYGGGTDRLYAKDLVPEEADLFFRNWFRALDAGIRKMDREELGLLFSGCAKQCAGDALRDLYRPLSDSCGGDPDRFFARLHEVEGVGGCVREPGRVYEWRFLRCSCDLHKRAGISSPGLCECSRRSILQELRELFPGNDYDVRKISSILSGGMICRFRIRKKEKPYDEAEASV